MLKISISTLFCCLILINGQFITGNNRMTTDETNFFNSNQVRQRDENKYGGYALVAVGLVGFVLGGFTGGYIATNERIQRVDRVCKFNDISENDELKNIAINETSTELEGIPSIELEVYNSLKRDFETCLTKLDTVEIAMLSQAKDFGNAYKTLYQSHEDIREELFARDFEEFKLPDADDDDIVTYQEFIKHQENYRKAFPESTSADFPNFQDIDLNKDFMLTFEEWQQYSSTKNSGHIDYGSRIDSKYL